MKNMLHFDNVKNRCKRARAPLRLQACQGGRGLAGTRKKLFGLLDGFAFRIGPMLSIPAFASTRCSF